MSAADPVLGAIQAQGAAGVLIELVRAGSAQPDALSDALQYIPPAHHRDYLRVVKKTIEGGPR